MAETGLAELGSAELVEPEPMEAGSADWDSWFAAYEQTPADAPLRPETHVRGRPEAWEDEEAEMRAAVLARGFVGARPERRPFSPLPEQLRVMRVVAATLVAKPGLEPAGAVAKLRGDVPLPPAALQLLLFLLPAHFQPAVRPRQPKFLSFFQSPRHDSPYPQHTTLRLLNG
jgi:hypothetical protein